MCKGCGEGGGGGGGGLVRGVWGRRRSTTDINRNVSQIYKSV